MGVSLSAYNGPIIWATASPHEVPNPFHGCSNTECPRHKKGISQNGNFCDHCGEKNTNIPRTKTVMGPTYQEKFDLFDANGLGEDDIYTNNFVDCPDNVTIYLANQASLNRRFHPESARNFLLDITDIDVETEKQWMAEKYAKHIEVLKQLYDSVEIKWVIMNYES